MAITIIVALSTTSCTRYFYQVYQATPVDNSINDRLIHETQDFTVSYNFWEDGGNFGFVFYNKTDENIYINMKETFFIQNDVAYNYFQDRTFTSSRSSLAIESHDVNVATSVNIANRLNLFQTGKKATLSSSSNKGVTYQEEEIVCIPPNASKVISEYNIVSGVYRDCDLFRYPKRSQIITKQFSQHNTPYTFSNRITYTKGVSDYKHKIDHEFYVSEITNYREKDVSAQEVEEFCGQKGTTRTVFTIEDTADKFYLRYNNRAGGFKKH